MIADSIILEKLEKCYLPELAVNLEERENHAEFDEWDKNLSNNFPAVINLLNDLSLKECSSPATVLSSLLLLYYQLRSEGRWKTRRCEEFAQKLNYQFQLLHDTTLANLLKTKSVYNSQEIFDKSMELLHQKLSPNDFKKYPALIEAYCAITNDLKDYEVISKPVSVLPTSLNLIEDYLDDNRLKGLQSASSILKCLTQKHFEVGNYYEVVYRVLKKVIIERNLEITKLTLECLSDLFSIIPDHAKVSIIDETLEIVLDQMYTETNLYRKKSFFTFVNKIIHLHGVHCVNKPNFIPVICDNLDVCSNEAVEEILLLDVVECLENWIKYCWCVWKLYPNQKLMSVLIKILYITREKENITNRIKNIFITLCKLSSVEEQKEIASNIEKSIQDVKSFSETFAKTLEEIRSCLC